MNDPDRCRFFQWADQSDGTAAAAAAPGGAGGYGGSSQPLRQGGSSQPGGGWGPGSSQGAAAAAGGVPSSGEREALLLCAAGEGPLLFASTCACAAAARVSLCDGRALLQGVDGSLLPCAPSATVSLSAARSQVCLGGVGGCSRRRRQQQPAVEGWCWGFRGCWWWHCWCDGCVLQMSRQRTLGA